MANQYRKLLAEPTIEPTISLEDNAFLNNDDSDDNDENGFVPIGTATIVPYPLKEDHFVWSEIYNHPLVQVGDQKLLQKLQQPDQRLIFNVIVYKRIRPGIEKTDQLYVFIGSSNQVSQGFWNTFIRYDDLVHRLGKDQQRLYRKDQDRFDKNKIPFSVWNQFGDRLEFEDVKGAKGVRTPFEEFLKSPGRLQLTGRDDRMFAFMCSWASVAMFPPKEPYSTVMRFFDKPVPGVKLYFRIKDTMQGWFKDQVDEVITNASNRRNAFLPTGYRVTTFSDPQNEDFEKGKILLGRHPIGLYETWARDSDRKILEDKGMLLPPFQFFRTCDITPEDNQIKLSYPLTIPKDARDTLSLPQAASSRITETIVTPLKINAARGKDRITDQNEVMGGHSALSVAKRLWAGVNADKDKIEWLHRSAFSYGGLGKGMTLYSSQRAENLVLGTKATNTAMLRVEEFIKRYSQRERAKVSVSTRAFWPDFNDTEPLNRCAWMAPWIAYTFSCLQGQMDTHKEFPPTTIYFETRARLTPSRFDFELGRYVEAKWFGWNDIDVNDAVVNDIGMDAIEEEHPIAGKKTVLKKNVYHQGGSD